MPIRILIVSAACLAALLMYLSWEKLLLAKRLRRLPLRVAVTGTRGKSSVVRLIAAALRASGRRVLARTTGSRPVLIHPDGSEHEIKRTGAPNLLEGKTLLKRACQLGADSVVIELMSIHPEYLRAETCLLFRPAWLALTNFRLDHQDSLGWNRNDIARSLAAAVPPDGTVFLLEEEAHPVLEEQAEQSGSKLVRVARETRPGRLGAGGRARTWDFSENTRLALAVAMACGVERKTALKAMSKARPDLGAFQIWKVRSGVPARMWRCVSAFAANEPESTAVLLGRLRTSGLLKTRPRVALLNLRDDRPDRTLQWLAASEQGFFKEFEALLVSGASAAASRLWKKTAPRTGPPVSLVHEKDPALFMKEIGGRFHDKGGLLFGAGNIGGLGRGLVELWERTGVSRD